MDKIATGAIFFLTFVAPPNQSGLSPSLHIDRPVPAVQPTTPKQKFEEYTVEAGDTFNSIAKEQYGSEKFWKLLWNDNPDIGNPAQIHKGQVLKIRADKPEDAEDLTAELSKKLETLHPSATPTPTPGPIQAPIVQAPPSDLDSVYQAAGARYGVPWQILYGIHHMETGGRDGAITSGYGTGAQGPLQFMPGTWASYGVDGNGDGNADINNAVDAIYGAANFIASHGGVDSGLRAYGGDTALVLSYARSRGYSQ